ncbi:MAG: flagellar biosynthesis protein FlhF [Oxalobacter sp.]|jgi:flagellar biosynthesis protein FlhF|nr:MAG: flagellar biosynthesis protein FlhF [Oxalobacter sp.]
MNVKKFFANSPREALVKVRDALGADAVILSNRQVHGGVEIMALAPEDMSALVQPVIEHEALSAHALAALTSKNRSRGSQSSAPSNGHQPIRLHDQNGTSSYRVSNREAVSPPREFQDKEAVEMMNEIRSMRGMLETQLTELSWTAQHQRNPVKAEVMREMLAAGFSATLARYLTENLPESEKYNGGMKWIKGVLARNLIAMNDENELLDRGGVFALVGPTGVGKTTTTAKIAARCVVRHGASRLALITTDGYRIGGFEQLRIYGKILGVMVHSVKDESDLRTALTELKGKHTILIDTVGMSQRDKMVSEQIAMLSEVGVPIKRLLCLSATSTAETLNEVVRAYKGDGLAGCVMTKLDEAATVGNLLDVVIRQKLKMFYIANGQRVPEDLHLVNKQYLIDRAFRLKRETTPFRYHDDELPLVVANTARSMSDKSLREVILG